MNVLINTPLLKSHAVRDHFDNKILIVFLLLIVILMVSGILFIDLMKSSYPAPTEKESIPESPQTTIISA